MIRISVQNRHSRTLLQDLLRSRVWKMHREPEVREAEAQVEECLDCPARITSKELAQLHHVKNGIHRSACSTSPKMDVNLGISAITHTASLTNSLARSPKRMVTKVQWLFWGTHDNWFAYFRTAEVFIDFAEELKTYWSQSDVFDSPKPCYVTLTFETKIHRLEWFAQVISNDPKFDDWSQEETERQERQAREAAWRLDKNIFKLKEKYKTTFFSRSESWCLPSPSTIKPEEREFVVDSGASMHMISKKGLEFRWNGNRDDIKKSDDGFYSKWRSALSLSLCSFSVSVLNVLVLCAVLCCCVLWLCVWVCVVLWCLCGVCVEVAHSPKLPSQELELNSFIRYCEWLEESGTCCSRPVLKPWLGKIQRLLLVNLLSTW